MFRTLLIAIVMAALFAGTAAAAAPAASPAPAAAPSGPALKIGIVDAEKIMAESPKSKASQAQLNQIGEDLTKRLDAEKPNLTPEQFKQKQEAYYTKYLQVKQDVQAALEQSMNQAIADVAKEKNLYLVVYKSGVALGGTDITDDVISRMR